MKHEPDKPTFMVGVEALQYGHQLVSNGYIVEKVDTSLKPLQSVVTDERGIVVGSWDDRQYKRIVLADSRSSNRLHLYPNLNLSILLNAGGHLMSTGQVNDRYEVREWQ